MSFVKYSDNIEVKRTEYGAEYFGISFHEQEPPP